MQANFSLQLSYVPTLPENTLAPESYTVLLSRQRRASQMYNGRIICRQSEHDLSLVTNFVFFLCVVVFGSTCRMCICLWLIAFNDCHDVSWSRVFPVSDGAVRHAASAAGASCLPSASISSAAVSCCAFRGSLLRLFLPARRYASAGLCDSDMSVRPSVTRRYCA